MSTNTNLPERIVLDSDLRALLDDTVNLLKTESASSDVDLQRKETLLNFLLQFGKLYDIEFPKFVGFNRITVSNVQPLNPSINDLWVDTN